MRFAHLLSRVTGTPWLITEPALNNITALIEGRINSDRFLAIAPDDAGGPASAIPAQPGDAVIPIHGIIGKRLSAMEMMCGGCDVDEVAAAFEAANADANVSRIVLHIDSPGGTVTGVPELAVQMYNEKSKPMVAVSDTLIGSAAYFLAVAADEIIVTPTAEVGSVGVALAVMESRGTDNAASPARLKVFRSGAHKMMGADAPLTEEQQEFLQGRVDGLGQMFRGFVSAARPGVAAGDMEGLVYFGAEAVEKSLADRVVANLREALTGDDGVAPVAAIPVKKEIRLAMAADAKPAVAAAYAGQPMTFNIQMPAIQMPAISVAAPTITTNVDARLEKDSISVTQNSGGAKKILKDASGAIVGIDSATP